MGWEPIETAPATEMCKWITTTSQLPDFNMPVLAYCRIYGRFVAVYEQIADSGFGQWSSSHERGILPPTHWMPLPDPPEDK